MADAPSPNRRHKGKLVLLGIAAALACYVIFAKLGILWFDARTDHSAADQAAQDAEFASYQWLTYISRASLEDTGESRRAAEELDRAAQARTGGDIETAQRAYLAAWQGYANAFRAEGEVVTALWTEQVDKPWREKLRGRFPFDEKATVEADPADVAHLLNPHDGTLWRPAPRFEALAAVELGANRSFSPAGMAEFLAAARALRDALFGGEKAISVHFEASVQWLEGESSLAIRLGSREVPLIDGGVEKLKWSQGGADFAIGFRPREGGTTVDLFEHKAGKWGMLRVLWRLETTLASEGTAYIIEGASLNPGAAQTVLTLRPQAPHNPFDPALFAKLKLP